MYLPETYQVKAILFHKGDVGKSSHKVINWRSFLDLVYGEEYQNKLKDRKLLGMLTHSGRRDARSGIIPHADTVAISPYLCNILTGVSDDENCVYGYFDLIDTEATKKFKNLVNMGVNIGVSISTELVDKGNEYEIKILHGVDFTLYPEFDSPIIDKNFSESRDNSFLVDYPVESPGLVYGDFSLKEFIKEATYPPYRVLKDKINEVVNYIKFNRESNVYSNKRFLKSYISSYIRKYLSEAISNQGPVNLIMGLRLDEYVDDRKLLRDLNMAMNTAKNELRGGSKSMSSQTQKRLNETFNKVMLEIYKYEEKRSGKNKDISTEVSSEPKNFSEGDKYKDIEDFILNNYTKPNFLDLYKVYVKQYVKEPVTEPILGDDYLSKLTEDIRLDKLVEDNRLSDLVSVNLSEFNYEPYDELLDLASDCRSMTSNDYENFKNTFESIKVKYPNMDDLYTEMGPSLDELAYKLGNDLFIVLPHLSKDNYPLAYHEFSYDDKWYMRLRPKTIAKLASRLSNRKSVDNSTVRDKLNSTKVQNVLGTVTGSKPLNFIDNKVGNINYEISRYTGATRHSRELAPQGSTGSTSGFKPKSFSEVSDMIISNSKKLGLENKPPISDNKTKSIPTGDKPDKPLGGNPNRKDMSFRESVDSIIDDYKESSSYRSPNDDMSNKSNSMFIKATKEFGEGLKNIEKGIKSTKLGSNIIGIAEHTTSAANRIAKFKDNITKPLTPIDSFREYKSNKMNNTINTNMDDVNKENSDKDTFKTNMDNNI